MISHSHPFKLIALCLLLLGPGGILEAASVKFIAMNEEIAGRKFGFKDSKGTTKLTDLTLLKRTKSYSCKLGKAPLELLEFNRADSPDKPVSTSITLPPDFKSALVLIMPDPKDPAALVGIALDSPMSCWLPEVSAL